MAVFVWKVIINIAETKEAASEPDNYNNADEQNTRVTVILVSAKRHAVYRAAD